MIEHLIKEEVFGKEGAVGGKVHHGDRLLLLPILHIDSHPQLEPMVFRDEVSQARTVGLPQAIEQIREAEDVCDWRVAFYE